MGLQQSRRRFIEIHDQTRLVIRPSRNLAELDLAARPRICATARPSSVPNGPPPNARQRAKDMATVSKVVKPDTETAQNSSARAMADRRRSWSGVNLAAQTRPTS